MSEATMLSALDPGKQGLKRSVAGQLFRVRRLSALDPGKQGLKPWSEDADYRAGGFQRLIQENKD